MIGKKNNTQKCGSSISTGVEDTWRMGQQFVRNEWHNGQ